MRRTLAALLTAAALLLASGCSDNSTDEAGSSAGGARFPDVMDVEITADGDGTYALEITISRGTVKTHLAHVYAKLGTSKPHRARAGPRLDPRLITGCRAAAGRAAMTAYATDKEHTAMRATTTSLQTTICSKDVTVARTQRGDPGAC